ncbi:MAG: glycosyl transferase family 2, partial [Neobacillus sp.]|nr:glycosyl transferase family 2 [Neobacillus sp.]
MNTYQAYPHILIVIFGDEISRIIETILSVSQQKYPNCECIVAANVDPNTFYQYLNPMEVPVVVLYPETQNLKTAIQNSNSSLIGFVYAGDKYLDDSFWHVAEVSMRHRNHDIGLVIGNGYICSTGDQVQRLHSRHVTFNTQKLEKNDYLVSSTVFVTHYAMKRLGSLDNLVYADRISSNLWCRIGTMCKTIVTDQPISISYINKKDSSVTSNNCGKIADESSKNVIYHIPFLLNDEISRYHSFNRNLLPKITIVTPSFNQSQFLERTIESVLGQEYPNLEYIIIDGGSSDDSVNIIKKYEHKLAFWVSEKDSGPAEAINKGFRRATGDIVVWLNSDD